MNLQFKCGTEVRRQKLIDWAFNGIGYLEVLPDQVPLHVHFVNPLAAYPLLATGNVFIDGGVRITGIQVTEIAPSSDNERILLVTASAAGDFSIYTLRLLNSRDDPAPPPAYDQVLSAVPFSFRAACPSDFDCQLEQACVEPSLPAPGIDCLAQCCASLRQRMLDRLALPT